MNPLKKAAVSFTALLLIASAFLAAAHAASYYYDPQGHVSQIVFSNGTTWVQYTYDNNGNRTSAVYYPTGTPPSNGLPGLAGSLWESATDFGNGWYYLNWFGYFYPCASGWIYHQQLGWPLIRDLSFRRDLLGPQYERVLDDQRDCIPEPLPPLRRRVAVV